MNQRHLVWAIAPLLLSVSGCKSVPRDAGFPTVKQSIAARLGKEVHWNLGSDSDAEVAQRVQAMLGGELSAADAVQIALLNNQNLQATYETLGVAQADVVQAGLLKNPNFNGQYLSPVGQGTPAIIGLDLAKDFLDVFIIPLRKKAAAAQFEATKSRVTAKVIDIATRTELAVYDLQAAQQALDMWRTTVQATEASFTAAKKMHEAGNISKLELTLERSLHDQAKLNLAQSEAAAIEGRERLNRLMGLWGKLSISWSVASRLPEIPAEEIDLTDFEKRAVEQSLQLAASRSQTEALARRRGVENIRRVFPAIELGVSSDREDDGLWHVGPNLGLEIPIFDQGQARRASARAEVRRALASHAALAVEIRSHTRANANRLVQSRARALFHRDEVLPLRKEILDQTQLQFNAMQIGVFQLLQVKRDQIEAGRQYIETLRDYWRSRVAVEQTLAGVSQSNGESTAFEDTGDSSRQTISGRERD